MVRVAFLTLGCKLNFAESSSLSRQFEAAGYERQSNQPEINLHEGDLVKHSKYGVGTVKKITFHSDKILCHINFDTCGRRLLDPSLSEIQVIS